MMFRVEQEEKLDMVEMIEDILYSPEKRLYETEKSRRIEHYSCGSQPKCWKDIVVGKFNATGPQKKRRIQKAYLRPKHCKRLLADKRRIVGADVDPWAIWLEDEKKIHERDVVSLVYEVDYPSESFVFVRS